MNGPIEGYITLQAAADMIGLSRPTLYRRLRDAGQSTDSSADNSGQSADSKPISIVRGKKRYISMDYVQALQQEGNSADTIGQYADSSGQSTDTIGQYADSSADSPPGTLKAALRRINDLERALMEGQSKLAALEATIAAQRGQIEYQQQLLDREQMIRLAAEQKKLPAGQGGLFAWIRGRVKNNT